MNDEIITGRIVADNIKSGRVDVYANTWRGFFELFEYKPNFEFVCEGDHPDHMRLSVHMMVPDSRQVTRPPEHKRHVIRVTKREYLPPWYNEIWARDYMRKFLRAMEDHELDEWFKYKGEYPFDPHKEQ